MVSAKFHITGEGGDWFRVRVQEEVYAHGLEGNVLAAERKTLAVVVEGSQERIERLHEDIIGICPDGVKCSGVRYDINRSVTGLIGLREQDKSSEDSAEHIIEVLKQLERRMARLELKMGLLLTLCEGGAMASSKPPRDGGDDVEGMDVGSDAVSGFSSLFGDQ